MIASFLVTKKFDPTAPLSGTPGNQTTGKARGKKGKGPSVPATSTPATPTPNGTPSQTPGPTADSQLADTAKSDTKPKTKSNVKEYYQPITIRVHGSPKVLDPLARVVKPPEQVRQHMNDTMDRMERADIEYLAMRLPREKPREEIGAGDGPVATGPARWNANNNGSGRAKAKGVITDIGLPEKDEEEEEELKDCYDFPSGLVPLR